MVCICICDFLICIHKEKEHLTCALKKQQNGRKNHGKKTQRKSEIRSLYSKPNKESMHVLAMNCFNHSCESLISIAFSVLAKRWKSPDVSLSHTKAEEREKKSTTSGCPCCIFLRGHVHICLIYLLVFFFPPSLTTSTGGQAVLKIFKASIYIWRLDFLVIICTVWGHPKETKLKIFHYRKTPSPLAQSRGGPPCISHSSLVVQTALGSSLYLLLGSEKCPVLGGGRVMDGAGKGKWGGVEASVSSRDAADGDPALWSTERGTDPYLLITHLSLPPALLNHNYSSPYPTPTVTSTSTEESRRKRKGGREERRKNREVERGVLLYLDVNKAVSQKERRKTSGTREESVKCLCVDLRFFIYHTRLCNLGKKM